MLTVLWRLGTLDCHANRTMVSRYSRLPPGMGHHNSSVHANYSKYNGGIRRAPVHQYPLHTDPRSSAAPTYNDHQQPPYNSRSKGLPDFSQPPSTYYRPPSSRQATDITQQSQNNQMPAAPVDALRQSVASYNSSMNNTNNLQSSDILRLLTMSLLKNITL